MAVSVRLTECPRDTHSSSLRLMGWRGPRGAPPHKYKAHLWGRSKGAGGNAFSAFPAGLSESLNLCWEHGTTSLPMWPQNSFVCRDSESQNMIMIKLMMMIMGDDTNPGRGLMEMIPPEACINKHEGRSLRSSRGPRACPCRPKVQYCGPRLE